MMSNQFAAVPNQYLYPGMPNQYPGIPMQYPAPANQYPGMPARPLAQTPPPRFDQAMGGPTQWQAPQQPRMPSQAYLAAGEVPQLPANVKARGVMADERAPLSPASRLPSPLAARGPQNVPPQKFVVPSPEDLGVSTRLNPPSQPTAPAAADWNMLHARMEKVGVLRYQKEGAPAGGVRVTLVLRTADPALGQPVEAVAQTEAAAALAAVERSEAWLRGSR